LQGVLAEEGTALVLHKKEIFRSTERLWKVSLKPDELTTTRCSSVTWPTPYRAFRARSAHVAPLHTSGGVVVACSRPGAARRAQFQNDLRAGYERLNGAFDLHCSAGTYVIQRDSQFKADVEM
jgi:hypothetical protein